MSDLKRNGQYKTLIPAVGLLMLVLAVRAHDVLQMPVFVDESLHIMRGKVVWTFSDLGESLNPKKLLFYYWIGFFGLNAPESVWLARTATALAALPGAALTYALGKRLFNPWAGLLALGLYLLVPFMVFFERLALADSFTATICLALIYTSLDFAKKPTLKQGLVVGAMLGLAALAKLTALPLALVPVISAWLFGKTQPIRAYVRPLIAAGIVFALLLTPPFAYVVIREITGTKDRVVVEEYLYTTDDRGEQILDNTERVFRAAVTLLSPEIVALVAVMMAYLAWRKPRELVFLGASIALAWGSVIVIAGALSTRYLVIGVPPLLVLIAGGVTDATGFVHREHRHVPNWRAVARLYWIAWALLGLWVVSYAVPFILKTYHDPTELDLPTRDRWEYFTNTSAGYALRELAADVTTLDTGEDGKIHVIGFVPNCHSLPLYWTEPNRVVLDCPLFKWDTTKQQEMTVHLMALAEQHETLYMAVEPMNVYDLGQLPLEWVELADYSRPHDGIPVVLYQIRMDK